MTLLQDLNAEREVLAAKREKEREGSDTFISLTREIFDVDERIARVTDGVPCCRNCGGVAIVAWYPDWTKQGIVVEKDAAGGITYDYDGVTDAGDEPGADDEYWCSECEMHSRDLDYLVGAKDAEEITRNGDMAVQEIAHMLDGVVWDGAADFLEAIANLVRSTGHKVREPIEDWTDEELTAELMAIEDRHRYHYPNEPSMWSDHERERFEDCGRILRERRGEEN